MLTNPIRFKMSLHILLEILEVLSISVLEFHVWMDRTSSFCFGYFQISKKIGHLRCYLATQHMLLEESGLTLFHLLVHCSQSSAWKCQTIGETSAYDCTKHNKTAQIYKSQVLVEIEPTKDVSWLSLSLSPLFISHVQFAPIYLYSLCSFLIGISRGGTYPYIWKNVYKLQGLSPK